MQPCHRHCPLAFPPRKYFFLSPSLNNVMQDYHHQCSFAFLPNEQHCVPFEHNFAHLSLRLLLHYPLFLLGKLIHSQYVLHLTLSRLIHLHFHKQSIQFAAYLWFFLHVLFHCPLKMLNNCITLMPCFQFIAMEESFWRGQTQIK